MQGIYLKGMLRGMAARKSFDGGLSCAREADGFVQRPVMSRVKRKTVIE